MTSTTTTWAIPYPTPLDRFCDGHLFTEQLAERTDAILTAFQADLKLLHNMPAAKVIQPIAPANVNLNGRVRWQAVEYDNENMVNLAQDPSVITYSRNGYWVFGAANDYLELANSAGRQYTATTFNTTGSTNSALGQATRDNGGNQPAFSTYAGMNRHTNFGIIGLEGEIETELFVNGATSIFFVGAGPSMYARWVGEL